MPSTAKPSATTSSSYPGDVVQLSVRDPAGNLVELDQPGVARLPDDIRRQVKPLRELHPQSEEQMRGRLFVGEPQSV
jgi:hypothetical protein